MHVQSIRSDDAFKLFWQNVVLKAKNLDVEEPTLHRRRKVPRRYEVGNSTPTTSEVSPEDHYRATYFEALDTVVAQITDRFEQDGYHMYMKFEKFLAGKLDSDESDEVFEFYSDDFVKDDLLAQLDAFRANYSFDEYATIHDIILIVQDMSPGQKVLFKEVIKLITLILVLPATNAVSERSFSAMRRTKSYLRTTMTQQRFNSIMLLHINKDYTDKIDLNVVCNEFRDIKDYRKAKFPIFR